MQLLLILIPGKILALALGIYYFRLLPIQFKLFFFQVCIALISECYGYYSGTIMHQNNIPAANLYVFLDSWLIGIAGRYFVENRILKQLIPFLLIVTSVIWVFDLLANGLSVLANRFWVCYSILLVIIYISTLFNKTFINDSIVKKPLFWISISCILYYSCVIPFIGLWNVILKSYPKLAEPIFNINLALNFIRYPLVALSFYLYGKQRRQALKAI